VQRTIKKSLRAILLLDVVGECIGRFLRYEEIVFSFITYKPNEY